MTQSPGRKQNKRLKLMRDQAGICYYCQGLMVLPDPYPPILEQRNIPNLCTIEHLFDRYDPRRKQRGRPGEIRRVGACFDCNQSRAHARNREFRTQQKENRNDTVSTGQ